MNAETTIISFKSKELFLENLKDKSEMIKVVGTNHSKEHPLGELLKYNDLKKAVEQNYSILINGMPDRRIVMRVLRKDEEEFSIADYFFKNRNLPIGQIVECTYSGGHLIKGLYAGDKEIKNALEHKCTVLIDQHINKIETMIRGRHSDVLNIGLAYSKDTRNFSENVKNFMSKYQ